MKSTEVIKAAKKLADQHTSCCGGDNAERILKLAWEKVKVKNVLLKEKYKDEKK